MTLQFKAFESSKVCFTSTYLLSFYDFVSVQLINVEVIQVCVACVVIIENTLSKKVR